MNEHVLRARKEHCKPRYLKKEEFSCNWNIWSHVDCVLQTKFLPLDNKGSLRNFFILTSASWHCFSNHIKQLNWAKTIKKAPILFSRAGQGDVLDSHRWNTARPKVKWTANGFEFCSATLDYAMVTGWLSGLCSQFAVAKAVPEPDLRTMNASSHSTTFTSKLTHLFWQRSAEWDWDAKIHPECLSSRTKLLVAVLSSSITYFQVYK